MLMDSLLFILANRVREETRRCTKGHCYGCRHGELSQRSHSCHIMDETEHLNMWFDDAVNDIDFGRVLEVWEKEVQQTDIDPEKIKAFKEKVMDETWRDEHLPNKDKMYDFVKRCIQVETRFS